MQAAFHGASENTSLQSNHREFPLEVLDQPQPQELRMREAEPEHTTLQLHESTSLASQDASQQTSQCVSASEISDLRSKSKSSKRYSARRATAESPNICFECKTTDSKLWRRGPEGNLMCNACGLRWRRSNKAKEALESAPRKRKASGAASLVPQPMTLPQSSMMAAQRGGFLTGAFVTNVDIFPSLPNKTFGHIHCQPQNTYLHQQAQFRVQQQEKQRKIESDLQKAQEAASRTNSSTSTRTNDALTNALPSVENFPNVPDLFALRTTINSKPVTACIEDIQSMIGPVDEVKVARLVQNCDVQSTHDSRVEDLLATERNVDHELDTTSFESFVQEEQSLSLPPEQDLINAEQNQHDDFSQLLSLKAFIDDPAGHF